MSQLFSRFRLRNVDFPNRVFVSPMCQYSAEEGVPTDWHLVHLGSRAVGGAGLVMAEATGVSPEGRISPWDTGLWNDEQERAFRRIAAFIRAQGSVPAIQLAHAGRKASTDRPWLGGKPLSASQGGWQPMAPSPIPCDPDSPTPREMTRQDMEQVREHFRAAAQRARRAGFEVVEIHMAHGYLLHEFLSPISNCRTDAYGGSLANRMRFPLEVATAIREAWPSDLPVFVRISASDWVEGGWDVPQSIEFTRQLKAIGIDLIDCSSGGMVPDAKMELRPGYQVPFSEAIRKEVGIATGAVGMITEPEQAEQIVASGQADAIFLARILLYDPYWPLHAASRLGDEPAWPPQYLTARRIETRVPEAVDRED